MMPSPAHAPAPPSPWVVRWAEYLVPGAAVLDLACGSGRHARWFGTSGHPVEAVDRDAGALAMLDGVANVATRVADLESGPWPYAGRTFGAVIVTNYLYRPLFPALLAAVAPGGLLVYETFARGNERHGRPSNPDFLLEPGELLERVRGELRVLGYEDVEVVEPRPACVQRLCARR